jgi:hypothetical protein
MQMPDKSSVTTNGKNTTAIKGMGMSLSWAEFLSYWGNWILVAALLVGVAATFGIVVSGNVKETALKRDLASQNARAAELEIEAALARLETEKIKEVVAWRTIPPGSVSDLENVLAAKPGSVNLRYTDGDPEALFLAVQISRILAKANWQIAPGSLKPPNTLIIGIVLPDATGVDAQTLRSAFSAAKIPFSTTPLPTAGGTVSFSVTTIPGAPMLMVGSKAPPQLP